MRVYFPIYIIFAFIKPPNMRLYPNYLKIRKFVFMLFLFFTIFNIRSQVIEQPFKLLKSVKLNMPSQKGSGAYIQKIYNNNLFVFFQDFNDPYITKNYTVCIYVINLSTYNVDSVLLNFNFHKIDEISKMHTTVSDFILENNDLYLIVGSAIIKFRQKRNAYEFDKLINLEHAYWAKHISNYSKDYAIISISYDAINDNKLMVFAAKINLNNGRIEKEIRISTFKGIEFSHIPNHWWDFTDKYFLLSQTLDYKIMIYDKKNFELIDSIIYDKNEFKRNKPILDSFKFKGKSSMTELMHLDDIPSRIIKTYFINNDTIMVNYQTPFSKNKFIDVWAKSTGKWNLILSSKEVYADFDIPNETKLANNNFKRLGLDSSTDPVFYKNNLIYLSKYFINYDLIYGSTWEYYLSLWRNSSVNSDKIDKNHVGFEIYKIDY